MNRRWATSPATALRRLSRWLGVAAMLGAFLMGTPVAAQTLTSSFNSLKPALGTVVLDATQPSGFAIDTTGLVSAPATSAITVDATNPLRLVFACSGGSSGSRSCRNETASVTLAVASAPAGVALKFRCSGASGSGVTVTCPTTAAAPYVVTISSNNSVSHQAWTVTVPLDVDLTYASSAARGNGAITVGCSSTVGTSTCGSSPSITFKSVRAMSVSASSDLAFGTLLRPASGSGTVTVATSGTRSVAGSAAILPSSPVSRARFTVTGEGQQQISVNVPATIPLRSGANTLTVTTTNSLPGGSASQVLGGSLGGNAGLDIDVGGSITLTSSTPSGVYAGSFTITASYQ